MKSDYLNDQYLLETEQEQDFWKKMQDQLLFINEIPAIGNFDAYEKLAQHGYLDTVMPYISSDFEVFKLYLATHVAKCTEAASRNCSRRMPSSESQRREHRRSWKMSCSIFWMN